MSFPEGLTAVVVNGALAWSAQDGEIVRAGRALRRG